MSFHTWSSLGISHIAIIALFVVQLEAGVDDGISFIVPAGKKEFFFFEQYNGDKMDVDFQVVKGGAISVVMLDPRGDIILQGDRINKLSRDLDLKENGTYVIILDNTFNVRERIVFLFVHIFAADASQENVNVMDVALERDKVDSFLIIAKRLRAMHGTFGEVRSIQSVHRSMMRHQYYLQKDNLDLVTWFSFISCVLIGVVGLLQVAVLKRLFKETPRKGLSANSKM